MKKSSMKLICLLCLFASTFSNASPTLVGLTGSDKQSNYSYTPVFIKPTQDEHSWRMIKNVSNLPEINFLLLNKVACHDLTCVMTGSYISDAKDPDLHSLLMTSKDGGESWNRVNQVTGFPNNNLDSTQNTSFAPQCFDKKCIVIVDEIIKNLVDGPHYLLASYDNGQSWSTQALQVSNLPADVKSLGLSSIVCQQSTCFALGYYRVGDALKWLTLISNDLGNTWNAENNLTELPTVSYQYYKLTLLDNDLLLTSSVIKKDSPFIFISKDKGTTWQTINFSLPNKFESGHINKIQTINGKFILSGVYSASTQDQHLHPLIIASNVNKLRWQMIDLPSVNDYIHGIDIGCLKSSCIVTLNTLTSPTKYEGNKNYIFNLDNVGEEWKVSQNKPDFSNFNDFLFRAINCNAETCMIIGNIKFQEALVLITHDAGKTWLKVKKFQDMPKDSDFYLASGA